MMASHLRSSDFTKQEEATVTVSTKEEIQVGAVAIRVLVEGEHSGGSVALFEFDVPAGARVPVAHSHDGYEETIYGLEGVSTWTVGGAPTDVGPGAALLHPARRRAPLRQPPRRRREGARDRHARRPRPRLFPRPRGDRRRRR